MELGIIMNCILIASGSICAGYVFNLIRIKYIANPSIKVVLVIMGIIVVVWNYSEALLGFCTTESEAYVAIAHTLAAFSAYMIGIGVLATELLGLKGWKPWFYNIANSLFAIIDFVIFGLGKVHTFTSINGRMAYYTSLENPKPVYFHMLYVTGIFAFWIFMGFYYGMELPYKRQRVLIINMMVSNSILMVAAIPDTFLPVLGIPEFPSSGIGAVVSYFVMISFMIKNNSFRVNEENVRDYVFDEVKNGVVVSDLEGCVVISNGYAKELLGLEGENEYLWDVFDTSKEHARELYLKTKDEEPELQKMKAKKTGISCAIIPAVVKDNYGDPYCMIMTVADNTREDELLQEVLDANYSKSEFLANMSHEIRTPINAVLGMNEMIMRESKDENIKSYADNTERAGRALLATINDILDYSKIESGKMTIVPVDYHLQLILADCYHMVISRAKEKNLKLEVHCNPDTPNELFGDDVRVRQCLLNLLTNAVKYTKEGIVSLNLDFEKKSEDEVFLIFTVKDTGVGIEKKNMDKLFASFQRFEEKKNRNIEGTGLGLAITQNLVELMNGTIEVESVYGLGSSFKITIPQTVVGKSKIGKFETVLYDLKNAYKDYKVLFVAPSVRVLVVDDVPMNLNIFKALLKSTQIQIDTALSGKEALVLAGELKYDIIFMDHMMPDMDGIETFQEMRAIENHPNANTPVIMLTAKASHGLEAEYKRIGFAEYIVKPVKGVTLEQAILKFVPEKCQGIKETEMGKESAKNPDKTDKSMADVFELNGITLDVKKAMEYCVDDEDFLIEVLEEYLAGKRVDELKTLFADENWDRYRTSVHALKSTSLSVGATDFSAKAKKMEKAAENRELDYVKANHELLLEEYDRVLATVEALLSKMTS